MKLANNNKKVNKKKIDKPEFPLKPEDQKVTTDTTEGAEKPAKPIEKSIQLRFVEDNKFRLDIKKQTFENGEILYKWSDEENCWKKYNVKNLEKFTFNWLKDNAPKFATDKMVKSCISCLGFDLPEVPPAPTDNIIPLKNTWLKINAEAKQIEIVQPTKEAFIDYSIATSLKFKQGQKTYEPQTLKEGSLFKQYIESSQPNPERRQLLQEYCGYTLMKENPFQVAQIWEGFGSDGKSVIMKLQAKLHHNHTTLDLDNLKDTNLIKLVGKSLVIVPETPKKGIDEQIFKRCVSSDIISVKALFNNPVDYVPTAKWIVSCNEFPYVSDASNGFWRRVQVIKWEVQFEGNKIIRDLDKKIIDNELDIYLDWCLEGLLRLLNRGYFDTTAVDNEKKQKKIASNSILSFIDSTGLELTNETDKTTYRMKKDDIYKAFKEYCEENGFGVFNSTKFWLTVNAQIKGIDQFRKTIGHNKKAYFVNLHFNVKDDAPTPPTQPEPPKPEVKPEPAITPRTPEGEALAKAMEKQKEEARIQAVIKQQEAFMTEPEAPADQKKPVFKPLAIKLKKQIASYTQEQKETLRYGLEQKIKVQTATAEEALLLELLVEEDEPIEAPI